MVLAHPGASQDVALLVDAPDRSRPQALALACLHTAAAVGITAGTGAVAVGGAAAVTLPCTDLQLALRKSPVLVAGTSLHVTARAGRWLAVRRVGAQPAASPATAGVGTRRLLGAINALAEGW